MLSNHHVIEISKVLNKTIAQVIFAFSRQIGMLPLTGTTNIQHMKQDLESKDIILSEKQISLIESISLK